MASEGVSQYHVMALTHADSLSCFVSCVLASPRPRACARARARARPRPRGVPIWPSFSWLLVQIMVVIVQRWYVVLVW